VEPKRIVRVDSLSKPAGPKVEELVTPPAPGEKAPRWKFVKLFGVGQELVFKDGSKFKFPLIQSHNGSYWPNSEIVTEDRKLAENLRRLSATDHGVVEVK